MRIAIFLYLLMFPLVLVAESDLQAPLPGKAEDMAEFQRLAKKLQLNADLLQQANLDKAALGALDNKALLNTLTGKELPENIQSRFEQFFQACPDCRDVVIVTGSRNRLVRHSDMQSICRLQCATQCQEDTNP